MASDTGLILQLPRDSAVDRHWLGDLPPSVASGEIVLEHLAGEAPGRLAPPKAGQVVLSVLSPEALTREPDQVQDVLRQAGPGDEPLVILIEAAAELREDELAVVLRAAARADRQVILRVMTDA